MPYWQHAVLKRVWQGGRLQGFQAAPTLTCGAMLVGTVNRQDAL